MSGKPTRGGAGGGAWTSSRVAQKQTTAPATAAPAVQTPMSAPHPPGGHGFEDSAVGDHARRLHAQAGAADTDAQSTAFNPQVATDTLSNLYMFREWEDYDKYKPQSRTIVPSGLDFKKEVLSKIKPLT